jgi:glycosyltransferase involved in cell wall biosynthesis
MKYILLIPTLNEIEGLRAIMPRIKKEWLDPWTNGIMFVDGGSTDGTVDYIRSLGYEPIQHTEKGLWAEMQNAVIQTDADVIITFSPDNNSIPELIPALIAEMKKGYDMVVVSRYAKGACSYDDDIVTAFGNWMFTKAINVLFGSKYTDTLCIFRAWRTNMFFDLGFHSVKSRQYITGGMEPLLCIRAAQAGLRCGEIPGVEPKRIGGVRKMSPLRCGWGILIQIAGEFLRFDLRGAPCRRLMK